MILDLVTEMADKTFKSDYPKYLKASDTKKKATEFYILHLGTVLPLLRKFEKNVELEKKNKDARCHHCNVQEK